MSISKSIVAHTFLFALFPVVFAYSVNMHELLPQDVILPAMLLVGISFAIWIALRFVLKSGRKAGLIISVGLVLFFIYGHVYNVVKDYAVAGADVGRHRYLIVPFLICFIISTYYFVRTNRKLDNTTVIANVISATLIAIILVNVVTYSINENYIISEKYDIESATDAGNTNTLGANKLGRLPDVYYIILDEYAGPRGLEFLQYDNSEFLSYLTEKGFYLPADPHSNYPMTHFSVPSSMNMRYINYFADQLGKESKNYLPVRELLFNSEVIQNFKSLGYKIVIFNSGWVSPDEFKNVDVSLCKDEKFVDSVLLDTVTRTSMIGYFVERWSEQQSRDRVLCTFSELPTIKDDYEEPVFVFAHMLIPHAPYVFGPNGEAIVPGTSLYSEKWDEKLAYIDQLKFTNKETQTMIEKLLEDKDKEPLIIIQSDHGTGFIDWKNPTDDMLRQRFSNFNAYYFPDDAKNQLYERITPVNSFRVIFDAYFNGNYPLLEDKAYWSNGYAPYDIRDVTDIVIKK